LSFPSLNYLKQPLGKKLYFEQDFFSRKKTNSTLVKVKSPQSVHIFFSGKPKIHTLARFRLAIRYWTFQISFCLDISFRDIQIFRNILLKYPQENLKPNPNNVAKNIFG